MDTNVARDSPAASGPLFAGLLLLAFAVHLSVVPATASAEAEGQLSALRDDVRLAPPTDPKPKKKKKKAGRRRRSADHCDDDDDDDNWWGELLAGVITSPFWAPPVILGDEYTAKGYFPRFPYEEPLDGYLMIDPWLPAEPFSWATRVNVEYVDNFNDLSSINGRLLIESSSRFGIDSEIAYRTEALSPSEEDSLVTGDVNVVFRFAQAPKVELRSGLGLNWLADERDANFGFNFTYGGDWFPRRPWIVSADLDWGWLGNANLLHLRATLGVVIRGGEIYVGFDYYDLESTEISSLISGVRLWF